MKLARTTTKLALALALGGLALAPMTALARDDKGKSPKKNGRHDNRDWNRGDDRDDRWRSDNDRRDSDWRRPEENRRAEEFRRRLEEQRRFDEQRRRQEDWRRQQDWQRRNDDCRYRDDDRRYGNDRYHDNSPSYEYYRREQTKNDWRNLANVSGLLAVIGLLNDDPTLTFMGSAGALYSNYRYQQDLRSQDRICRLRAQYFSQPYFYRDGQRYSRHSVSRNGQQYYQFCKD